MSSSALTASRQSRCFSQTDTRPSVRYGPEADPSYDVAYRPEADIGYYPAHLPSAHIKLANLEGIQKMGDESASEASCLSKVRANRLAYFALASGAATTMFLLVGPGNRTESYEVLQTLGVAILGYVAVVLLLVAALGKTLHLSTSPRADAAKWYYRIRAIVEGTSHAALLLVFFGIGGLAATACYLMLFSRG